MNKALISILCLVPLITGCSDPDEKANELYKHFIRLLEEKGLQVATGKFQAMMDVFLVNDGPVTLMLDSAKGF